ncbi:tyrosine-type recombinase/integrase [Cnuibacter physcomitrellae]|uniref:tyrosine-type recombinase/integrase n=1 Tax=Cnuibacter physcomitrellae TaxID=1619308 RepID=UPI0035712B74
MCLTQKAAKAALNDLRRERDNLAQARASAPTFAAAAEQWFSGIPKSRAPKTLESYRYLLDSFVLPTFSAVHVDRIELASVQTWLTDLAADYSPNTVKRAKQCFGAVLNFCVRAGTLQRNVVATAQTPDIGPGEDAVCQPYSLAEVRSLLRAAEGSDLYPILLLAVHYGLRRGEVLGLTWADLILDGDHPQIRIRGSLHEARGIARESGVRPTEVKLGATKTRSSRRTIAIAPPIADALRQRRDRQEEWQEAAGDSWTRNPLNLVFTDRFGAPLYPTSVARSFQRLAAKAGLRRIRFHDLRHTAAVMMLEAGTPIESVSQALGHASIEITKRVYAPYVQALIDRAAHAVTVYIGV